MDKKIIENASKWSSDLYFGENDRQELRALLKDTVLNEKELNERFHRDLEFGTGGLRAPMGMGMNRMNQYNVRRATQAMANCLLRHFKDPSAVISYDSRHRSLEFAREAASVFAGNGIRTHLFSALTPTPMLSFGVRYFRANAGIMITASHNPPIYNGFKAFWADGAQVVPPIDKEIIDEYNSLTDWSKVKSMDFENALGQKMIQWTNEDVDNAFYQMIEDKVIQDTKLLKDFGSELSIVYTALHGTGEVPAQRIAKKLGLTRFYSVESQSKPDGNFPTVKSPNPEDPKALALAIEYMLKHKADIVYGTDPDGDRLGVVVNHLQKGEILNGNQIAAIMIYYVLSSMAQRDQIPKSGYIVKSIVTSPLQNAIANAFKVKVFDTLTGFKWMAALIGELEKTNPSLEFIFASEESFGYMPHNEARDKDGISALALVSEAALFFKRKNMTLVNALDEIYTKYGFFYESLLSFEFPGIDGSNKIGRIMSAFRHYSESHFLDEEIISFEDYSSQSRKDYLTQKKENINLPASDVLCFNFKSGNKLFLRPSGTEPKIKFYTMVQETKGLLLDKKTNALKRVQNIEEKIKLMCEKA